MSLTERIFYRNSSPLCTETWEGAPNQGLLRKVTIPGETVTLTYDNLNRLIERTRTDTLTGSEPRTTRYSYHGTREITIDGPRADVNDIQHLVFDRVGNIVEFTNAAGHRFLMEFAAQGRQIGWSGPNGERREFEYDERDRIVVERAAPGTGQQITLTQQYDDAGRLVASQRNSEPVIWRSYDDAGRLAGVSDSEGASLRLQYDDSGELQGIHASHEFGAAGGESLSGGVKQPVPLNPAYPDTYDRPTLASGVQEKSALYQYDHLNRVVSSTAADGSVTRYEYNGFGEVIAEHSQVRGTTRYGYDTGGNRVWEARADGTEIRRQFDAMGRSVQAEYRSATTTTQVFQYRYDECAYGVGRLCESIAGADVTRYDYDIHGSTVRLETVVDGHTEVTDRFLQLVTHNDPALSGSHAARSARPEASVLPYVSGRFGGGVYEFFWDSSCRGIPYPLPSTTTLASAWRGGFRSVRVWFTGKAVIDSSFTVDVQVGVCYQLEVQQNYVFNFQGQHIYFGPEPDINLEPEEEKKKEEEKSWPPIEHDYAVDTEICSNSENPSWCRIENIACWAKRYYAPGKEGGYGRPATQGETVNLEYRGTDNPIRVAAGPNFGLPANAVAQITQDGHALHNEDMGQWGPGDFQCPKPIEISPVGTRNNDRSTPPAHCNQVYREPYKHNGKIYMHTRGTGNAGAGLDNLNELFGRGLFGGLDGQMKQAILADADRWCPDLTPPSIPPGPGDGELP